MVDRASTAAEMGTGINHRLHRFRRLRENGDRVTRHHGYGPEAYATLRRRVSRQVRGDRCHMTASIEMDESGEEDHRGSPVARG